MNLFPDPFHLRKGKGYLGPYALETLADRFGTPLYVLDGKTIQNQYQKLKHSLQAYPAAYTIFYAAKANANGGLFQWLYDQGCGIDCVSIGELHTAKMAGIPMDDLIIHGNNKSEKFLTEAISGGIKIVIDNRQDVERIGAICQQNHQSARVLLRLNPSVETDTHAFIQTGQDTSKFGMTLEEVRNCLIRLQAYPEIDVLGLHSHIGSQLFDIKAYQDQIDGMVIAMDDLQDCLGKPFSVLNVGGGFGVAYTDQDPSFSTETLLSKMLVHLQKRFQEKKWSLPHLMIEPGRFLVARAGITLYTVGGIKQAGSVHYAFVDGGMADNIRPMLYGAKQMILANKGDQGLSTMPYKIAGPFCESGDQFQQAVQLPPLSVGDRLIVLTTGAYTYSMASHYNRYPVPAMVLVSDDEIHTVVQRETIEDVCQYDRLIR